MNLLGVKNLWVFGQTMQLPKPEMRVILDSSAHEITYHVQSISSPKKTSLLSYITSLLPNFSSPA